MRPGRPEVSKKADAFLRMCKWLEDTEDSLYTLGELQQYLKVIFKIEDNSYCTRWLKAKLIDKYSKDHVIITEIVDEEMMFTFVKWITAS